MNMVVGNMQTLGHVHSSSVMLRLASHHLAIFSRLPPISELQSFRVENMPNIRFFLPKYGRFAPLLLAIKGL
jgi:hypothetical protein